ncbi:hypothetical protein RCL_jg26318.t1 [Rhizophagus clarus]|uniref:Uncharacterized protein n=1 Tax=Rhizophagus clarus TaxID=94130 RepID=A0A8H3KZZ8_9GLOM|nr:hypothetical protein RCL_jg26318.t1 [Rhizophagus clarus]
MFLRSTMKTTHRNLSEAGIINPLQSTISNSFNKKLKSPRGFIPEGGLEIVYVGKRVIFVKHREAWQKFLYIIKEFTGNSIFYCKISS